MNTKWDNIKEYSDIKFEFYNGVKVSKGWGLEIERSQLRKTTVVNDSVYSRITYGAEVSFINTDDGTCRGCGVIKGQIHVMGCEHEECPVCSGEFLYCKCNNHENM